VKFSKPDSVISPDIALIRIALAKSSVEYIPTDGFVRTAQTLGKCITNSFVV
jgi:hypothetical protein